jgi:hypothetical protein
MKIFFLDDSKERHERFRLNRLHAEITFAWTYEEACKVLSRDSFDVVYLSHNLTSSKVNKKDKNGVDLAEFLSMLPLERRPEFVVIHSFNKNGRQRMKTILSGAGIRCRISPFSG